MKISIQPSPLSSSAVFILFLSGNNLATQLSATLFRYDLDAPTLESDFKAEKNETLFLYNKQGQKIWLVGLGKETSLPALIATMRSVVYRQKSKLTDQVGVDFSFLPPDNAAAYAEGAANGVMLATYNIGLYKTTVTNTSTFDANAQLDFAFIQPTDELAAAAKRGLSFAQTQIGILNLMNAPANKITPDKLAEEAHLSGKRCGFEVTVFDRETLIQQGMGALAAVGQGSANQPVCIIAEYKPQNPKLTVGLVGKGVTFDTGGISIKPSANMHYMKSDMGGAAAVLGAMEMVAKLQLPVHLIGIMPATENCVDALAVKPGDVITTYSGKTVEIIDTDAEGRLILADGLAYMTKNYQPDVLIDLATLTGNVIMALGYQAAGLFTNNEQLAQQLLAAGQATGEKLWQMPLWEGYFNDIKSDIADIKNLGARPLAGAAVAAKFLEFFIDKHPCWAHLDIAGTAFGDSEFSTDKSATAYGIRLLTNFIENQIGQPNLIN